jgi:hypothetical protein
MGKELQRSTETDKRDIKSEHGNNPQPYSGTSGRRRKKKKSEEAPVGVMHKTVKHFFPDMNKWMRKMNDPRNASRCTYSMEHLAWDAILMFLLHHGSRMQHNNETEVHEFVENMKVICGQRNVDTVAHGDTYTSCFKSCSVDCFKLLLSKMIRRLIRMRVLDSSRFYGYFTVVIDGTGVHCFDKEPWPGCPYKTINGKKKYYVYSVDAKLVTPSGLALTIATVCLENQDEFDKQDCEKKAFYRLIDEIMVYYPRTKFCFLLDGLFADRKVIERIEEIGCRYMIVFKSGSMPERYREALTLGEMQSANRKTVKQDGSMHRIFWADGLDLGNCSANVLFCKGKEKGKKTKNVWLTNIPINIYNAYELTRGGRLRWKIENEGFKIQKINGYEMEHMYSRHPTASRILYILLQIAHIINQLIEDGNLIRDFKAAYGTMKNLVKRMSESFRNDIINTKCAMPGQIRLKAPT